MPIRLLMFLLFFATFSVAMAANPVKLDKQQIAGKVWQDFDVVELEERGNKTRDVEFYLSPERDFDAGIWSSGPDRFHTETPWPYNEYIHLTEGSLTLTSDDGTVLELLAGDAAVIPLGWTGTWDTPGMTKLYVIHAPNKDL